MSKFENNILSIYGGNGRKWLNDLPNIVRKLSELWKLYDISYLAEDSLSFNYIVFAKQQNKDITLKIAPKSDDIQREAACIRAFKGHGVVELLELDESAMLIQRAIPGKSLKKIHQNNAHERIKICCQTMQRLLAAELPSDKSNFMIASERFKPIFQDWDILEKYLIKARNFYTSLSPHYPETHLLHGDLHDDNIISNESDWLTIDPKGVIGHPIIEACCMIENFQEDTVFIAEFFKFNLQDLRCWYFTHTILATCWALEDGISPNKFLKIADSLYHLV